MEFTSRLFFAAEGKREMARSTSVFKGIVQRCAFSSSIRFFVCAANDLTADCLCTEPHVYRLLRECLHHWNAETWFTQRLIEVPLKVEPNILAAQRVEIEFAELSDGSQVETIQNLADPTKSLLAVYKDGSVQCVEQWHDGNRHPRSNPTGRRDVETHQPPRRERALYRA